VNVADPITRNFRELVGMDDPQLFLWRANAREQLSGNPHDTHLEMLLEAANRELDARVKDARLNGHPLPAEEVTDDPGTVHCSGALVRVECRGPANASTSTTATVQ